MSPKIEYERKLESLLHQELGIRVFRRHSIPYDCFLPHINSIWIFNLTLNLHISKKDDICLELLNVLDFITLLTSNFTSYSFMDASKNHGILGLVWLTSHNAISS